MGRACRRHVSLCTAINHCMYRSLVKKDGRSIGRDTSSSDNGMCRTHIHVLFELTGECHCPSLENFNLLYTPLEGATVPYSFRTHNDVCQLRRLSSVRVLSVTTISYRTTSSYFSICLLISHPVITKFCTHHLVVSVNIFRIFFEQESCCVVKRAKVWIVTPADKCRVGVCIHYKNGKRVASRVVGTDHEINDQLIHICR